MPTIFKGTREQMPYYDWNMGNIYNNGTGNIKRFYHLGTGGQTNLFQGKMGTGNPLGGQPNVLHRWCEKQEYSSCTCKYLFTNDKQ